MCSCPISLADPLFSRPHAENCASWPSGPCDKTVRSKNQEISRSKPATSCAMGIHQAACWGQQIWLEGVCSELAPKSHPRCMPAQFLWSHNAHPQEGLRVSSLHIEFLAALSSLLMIQNSSKFLHTGAKMHWWQLCTSLRSFFAG